MLLYEKVERLTFAVPKFHFNEIKTIASFLLSNNNMIIIAVISKYNRH